MSFLVSKLLWVLMQPSNVLLLALIAASVTLLLGRWPMARWLVIGSATALLLVSVLPIGQLLLIPLEVRFGEVRKLPGRVDGIIVLGGAVEQGGKVRPGQIAFGGSAERATALIELGHAYPNARLVYTGGNGHLVTQGDKPADTLRSFYQRQKFDVGRILFEDQSRNTYENALFSRRLLAPRPGERWLLVTSAAHMPRAMGIFRQIKWPMIPYPVDYRAPRRLDFLEQLDRLVALDVSSRLKELDLATKSWVGLVAYWLMGRTSALFPGPEASVRTDR